MLMIDEPYDIELEHSAQRDDELVGTRNRLWGKMSFYDNSTHTR